jgi:hypothetical protein
MKKIFSICLFFTIALMFFELETMHSFANNQYTLTATATVQSIVFDDESEVTSSFTIDAIIRRNGVEVDPYELIQGRRTVKEWKIEIWQVNESGVEIGGTRKTTVLSRQNAKSSPKSHSPYTNNLIFLDEIKTPLSNVPVSGNLASLKFKCKVSVFLDDEGAIIGGSSTSGFYGFVPSEYFISGNELASKIGLSNGTAQNSDAGWLKFENGGKTLYLAKRTFRHSISWDQINGNGSVFGTRLVIVNGKSYKVRLLTSAEWNILMYGVHTGIDPDWTYRTTVFNFPLYGNSDLGVESGDGSGSWVQDVSSSNRVIRGSYGITGAFATGSGSTNSGHGWRPVLELVD